MRSQIFRIWHQPSLPVAPFCLCFDVESKSNRQIALCAVCFVDDGLRWNEIFTLYGCINRAAAAWAPTPVALSLSTLDKRSNRSRKRYTTRVTIWPTKECLSSMLSCCYPHVWCRSLSLKFRYDVTEMAWVLTVRWFDTDREVNRLLRPWH